MQLQAFTFGPSLSLRVLDRDGEPWFVAKDVCAALGTATDHVRRALDPDEVISASVAGIRGRGSLIISESGLYRLMMRSDKAEARPFQRFVTREVLPAIRKRGAFMTQDTAQRVINDAQEGVRIAHEQLAETRRLNGDLKRELMLSKHHLAAANQELSLHRYDGVRWTVAQFVERHPEQEWSTGRRYELATLAGELVDQYGLAVQVELRPTLDRRHATPRLYPPVMLEKALARMPWYVSPACSVTVL